MTQINFTHIERYQQQKRVYDNDETQVDKKLKIKALNEWMKVRRIMREGK